MTALATDHGASRKVIERLQIPADLLDELIANLAATEIGQASSVA
jgi:hypothetical protein